MSIKVWPFLVSRNRYLDYRTVVAPDFICEAKIANLLARVAEGDVTEPGKGFFRQISGSKAGDFTIVFRVLKATEKDLNSTGGEQDEVLKDQFGREIYLIEGFVFQGIKSKKNISISNKNLQEVHKRLAEGYTQFWEYIDPHPAISSSLLSLSIDSSSSPLQLEELDRFQVSSKTRIPKSDLRENNSRENNSRIFIKPSINSLGFLVTIFLLLIFVFWFVNRGYIWGKNIVDKCTTTEVIPIEFEKNNNINDVLNKLQNNYPKATILLAGSLKVKSPQQWQSLTERKELNKLDRTANVTNLKQIEYTINLEGDSLKLEDHPLELAIAQLRNQQVINKTTIQAKIINRKKCPEN